MRALAAGCLLLAGCTSLSQERISGTVRSGCGAAEGGAVYLTLDAQGRSLIIWADGSWGRGGNGGWTLPSEKPDFTFEVCDQASKSCTSPVSAHLVIESATKTAIYGRVSYSGLGSNELRFRAVRTDLNQPVQVCG